MDDDDALRDGEQTVTAPAANDARLRFIGRIHTPFSSRSACPRQGDPENGPECRIEVDAPWDQALAGIEAFARLEILYWLDRARRDLVLQRPRAHGKTRGTFALRSPLRPNPIGTSTVALVRREGPVLVVRGLDCLDGTPLLDIKPDRGDRAARARAADADG